MPLPQDYAKGVLFVGRAPVGKLPRITATAFLVTVDSIAMRHGYVVTANHAIEGADETFVRVRMKDGTFYDETDLDWVPHGVHDVAVAYLDARDGHDLIATGMDHQFIDSPGALDDYGDIELGDSLYFIGLLGKVKAMTERNVPIVRTGFLGALWQQDVPVKRPGEATKWITAHLMDCRSFSGFSGSPVYLQKCRARVFQDEGDSPSIGTQCRTVLLGLVGGHFDDWAKTQSRDVLPDEDADEDDREDAYVVNDDVRARVSTGVGYVIPVEFIRETLMKEDLVKERAKKDIEVAEAVLREDERNAATEDSIPEAEETEYGRFESLTRRLVNTQKPSKRSSEK